MNTTIAQLRSQGFKVNVTHWRRLKNPRQTKRDNIISKNPRIPAESRPQGMYLVGEVPTKEKGVDYLHPKGGRTEMEVISPDGEKKSTFSNVSYEDSYDKHVGVNLCFAKLGFA